MLIDKLLENKKAVLFDFDGTLVDSMWMWTQIDKDFLAERNIPWDDQLQKNISGMSYTETAEYFIDTYNLTESVDQLKVIWNDMAMDNYRTKVPMKEGALDFLKELKKRGIKTGIATSNSPELARAGFDANGLGEYIQILVTSCQVEKGKPAPDVYLEVARQLKTDPEECMVFEDIPEGVKAGINAGMYTVAVRDSGADFLKPELSRMADYYLDSYLDLFV